MTTAEFCAKKKKVYGHRLLGDWMVREVMLEASMSARPADTHRHPSVNPRPRPLGTVSDMGALYGQASDCNDNTDAQCSTGTFECLDTCLYTCLYTCAYACLYTCLHTRPYICLYMSIDMSIHISIHMSIHMSIYLSIHKSIYMLDRHAQLSGHAAA